MNETQQPTSSSLGSVSVRAWLTVSMVLTMCLMSGLGQSIGEPLNTLTIAAVSFYFGNTARKT